MLSKSSQRPVLLGDDDSLDSVSTSCGGYGSVSAKGQAKLSLSSDSDVGVESGPLPTDLPTPCAYGSGSCSGRSNKVRMVMRAPPGNGGQQRIVRAIRCEPRSDNRGICGECPVTCLSGNVRLGLPPKASMEHRIMNDRSGVNEKNKEVTLVRYRDRDPFETECPKKLNDENIEALILLSEKDKATMATSGEQKKFECIERSEVKSEARELVKALRLLRRRIKDRGKQLSKATETMHIIDSKFPTVWSSKASPCGSRRVTTTVSPQWFSKNETQQRFEMGWLQPQL